MVQDISGTTDDLEHTLAALREEGEVAQALLSLSGMLFQVRSVEETLRLAVRVVPQLLGAGRCFAATWDPGRSRFIVHAHAGYEPDGIAHLKERARSAEGLPLLHAALMEESVLLVSDAAADPRMGTEEAARRDVGAYIGIPLMRRGEQFGGLGVEYDSSRTFGSKDESLARGVGRQIGLALAAARQFSLLQELRTFGLRVGGSPRLGPVVGEIARGAAELLDGDGSAVFLADVGRGTLVRAHVHGRQQGAETTDQIDLTDGPWRGLLEGKVVLVSRSGDELARPDDAPVGIIAAPILGSESPLAGAVLVFFDRAVSLSADETEALNVLSAQSSMAVENAQRFERQRRVARSLQEGLLATEIPPLGDFEIGAVYEPASAESDIGGDFFDVFDLGEGRVGVVVGDVSGKGAEAAAQTAQVKYMLRAFAIRNASPASVLFHLNNALVHRLTEEKFATCLFGVIDLEERRVQVALAGHPAPLIYRPRRSEIETLELPGTILGSFEDQQYEQGTFDLSAGDVFLAYTDGLVEARADKELYGRDRLAAALRSNADKPAKELARRLYEDVKRFGKVIDDTVVLALTCRGSGETG